MPKLIPNMPENEEAELREFLMDQAMAAWAEINPDMPFSEEQREDAEGIIDRVVDIVAVATEGMASGDGIDAKDLSAFITVANHASTILRTMAEANQMQLDAASAGIALH